MPHCSCMRLAAMAVLFSLSALANAQAITLADVKARHATQLDANELKRLTPAAKVVSRTPAGSTRRWENRTDGTLIASSDTVGHSGGRSRAFHGRGTWRVTDDGRYCVSIEWNVRSEQWCRHIFKAGDKYYGVGKLIDSARAHELTFAK